MSPKITEDRPSPIAQSPSRGADDPRRAALGPRTSRTLTAEEPSSPVRSQAGAHNPPCAGTKLDGQPCGKRQSLQCTDGKWYCRHHRKTKTLLKEIAPSTPHPPVTNLQTKADADKFLAWLLKAASQNAYNAAQVKAMLMVVSLWNRTRQRWEATMADRVQRLYNRMQAEVKAVRDSIKKGDGYDDDGIIEGRADQLEALIACWKAEFQAAGREAP